MAQKQVEEGEKGGLIQLLVEGTLLEAIKAWFGPKLTTRNLGPVYLVFWSNIYMTVAKQMLIKRV